MRDTIENYIKTFSKSVDNDSIVYIFDTGMAYGMARERITEQFPAMYVSKRVFDYYNDFFRQVLANRRIKNVIYKAKNGKWYKVYHILEDYPNLTDIFDFINNDPRAESYILHIKHVPEMLYTDTKGEMFKIYERDNSKFYNAKIPIFLDELNPEILELEQFSIENPSYGPDLKHLMNDLRIKFKTEVPENILINLNGLFVEGIKLTAFPDSLFIKNAKYLYRTVKEVWKEDATPTYIEDAIQPVADAIFDDNKDYKRNYNIKIRLFKWKDVNISPWISIESMKYDLQVLEYKNIRIPNTLQFTQELNYENTIILCNGLIMDPSEYEINGKKVYLKNLLSEFYTLYYEFKQKNMASALNTALEFINNRYYHAIQFTDADPSQVLRLRRTSPMEVSFMDKKDVLFDNVNSQDLITVDGSYLPYVIKSNGLVFFPKFSNDALFLYEDTIPFKERKITKYELVNYYDPTVLETFSTN